MSREVVAIHIRLMYQPLFTTSHNDLALNQTIQTNRSGEEGIVLEKVNMYYYLTQPNRTNILHPLLFRGRSSSTKILE